MVENCLIYQLLTAQFGDFPPFSWGVSPVCVDSRVFRGVFYHIIYRSGQNVREFTRFLSITVAD